VLSALLVVAAAQTAAPGSAGPAAETPTAASTPSTPASAPSTPALQPVEVVTYPAPMRHRHARVVFDETPIAPDPKWRDRHSRRLPHGLHAHDRNALYGKYKADKTEPQPPLTKARIVRPSGSVFARRFARVLSEPVRRRKLAEPFIVGDIHTKKSDPFTTHTVTAPLHEHLYQKPSRYQDPNLPVHLHLGTHLRMPPNSKEVTRRELQEIDQIVNEHVKSEHKEN